MQKTIDGMKAKMEKTLDVLAGEFKTLRAGRANPAIIDKVTVDYYGVPTPINQLAVVNVPEARTLTIQPWDSHTLKAIERAMMAGVIAGTYSSMFISNALWVTWREYSDAKLVEKKVASFNRSSKSKK